MRGPGSIVGQSVSMWTLSSECPHSYMWRLGAHCDAAYRARGQSCKRSGTLSLISLRRGWQPVRGVAKVTVRHCKEVTKLREMSHFPVLLVSVCPDAWFLFSVQ